MPEVNEQWIHTARVGRLAYECDGDARQQIRIRLLGDKSRYGLG